MKKAMMMVLLVFLAGCATTGPEVKIDKNYQVGVEKHAAIGEAMVSQDHTTTLGTNEQMAKTFAAVAAGPYAPPPSADPCAMGDKFRQELIYTGRTGDTMKITYREYKCDLARPSFFQDLTYDLSQSSTVVFKNFKLNILKADNEGVTFTVTSDGG
jgi:hypothetical protein